MRGPGSHIGVSERTDSERGEGTRAAGSCIWFLSVMIPCGGQTVVSAVCIHSAVSPVQRGTLCCLAEGVGLWFLT